MRWRGGRRSQNVEDRRGRGGLAVGGSPRTQASYERAGVECLTVEVDELLKAAGGIGCLTGVLERD